MLPKWLTEIIPTLGIVSAPKLPDWLGQVLKKAPLPDWLKPDERMPSEPTPIVPQTAPAGGGGDDFFTGAGVKWPPEDDGTYPPWHPVISSNVKKFRYFANLSRLEVEFLDGARYEYWDVDPFVYEMFQRTDSAGKFVWAWLRDQYPYRQIPGYGPEHGAAHSHKMDTIKPRAMAWR